MNRQDKQWNIFVVLVTVLLTLALAVRAAVAVLPMGRLNFTRGCENVLAHLQSHAVVFLLS